MKVKFKNKTKYTKEAYNVFLSFHQRKYGMKYKINTLIIIILFSFCVAVNFKFGNYGVGIIFSISVVCFLLYRFYNPINKIEKESNSEKIKNEREFVFTFYDHYMHILGNKLNRKISYLYLKKSFEDKDYIYLYINKNDAFVLKKDGFIIGDSKDFMSFIKRKVLFKI